MTTQYNKIQYPLSPACYSHANYVGFLEKADLNHETKEQIFKIHAKFMRTSSFKLSNRLTEKEKKFIQSKEYNQAVHQLDLMSGEYFKLLKNTAKQLFIKKYSMQECDFDVQTDLLKKVSLYIDFCEQSQEFRTWDKTKKEFHYLTLSEVECEYLQLATMINQNE